MKRGYPGAILAPESLSSGHRRPFERVAVECKLRLVLPAAGRAAVDDIPRATVPIADLSGNDPRMLYALESRTPWAGGRSLVTDTPWLLLFFALAVGWQAVPGDSRGGPSAFFASFLHPFSMEGGEEANALIGQAVGRTPLTILFQESQNQERPRSRRASVATLAMMEVRGHASLASSRNAVLDPRAGDRLECGCPVSAQRP